MFFSVYARGANCMNKEGRVFCAFFSSCLASGDFCHLLIIYGNSLDTKLDPSCLCT